MQVTIDIPDDLAARAQAEGVNVEEYVGSLLERAAVSEAAERYGWTRFGTATKTPAEAADNIRRIASRTMLAGVKIKDLIHEGHRY